MRPLRSNDGMVQQIDLPKEDRSPAIMANVSERLKKIGETTEETRWFLEDYLASIITGLGLLPRQFSS